jgi:hypothetical protein
MTIVGECNSFVCQLVVKGRYCYVSIETMCQVEPNREPNGYAARPWTPSALPVVTAYDRKLPKPNHQHEKAVE